MKKYILTALLWFLSLFMAYVFIKAGWAKFSSTSGWARAFAYWGYPAWFRVLVGVIESAGALLLLVPATAIYAAAALIVIMLGAMGTHIYDGRPGHITSEVVPVVFLTTIAILRYRKQGPKE